MTVKMKYPLVSVIIPTYNCDRYLAAAIESVLAQNYQPLEIIVVDDGSDDETAKIVQSFGQSIQYVYQTNQGTAAARNHGISLAKGDFLAFLDADDLWLKNKTRLQMAAFANNPQADVVFGAVEQFYSSKSHKDLEHSADSLLSLQSGHIPSAMIIKRDSFFKVGQFETHWQLAEFPSWYMRAIELPLTIVNISDLVAKRRLHQNNKGIRQSKHKHEYIQILKQSLDRRRQKKLEEA